MRAEYVILMMCLIEISVVDNLNQVLNDLLNLATLLSDYSRIISFGLAPLCKQGNGGKHTTFSQSL